MSVRVSRVHTTFHSLPTRRSSDLGVTTEIPAAYKVQGIVQHMSAIAMHHPLDLLLARLGIQKRLFQMQDRKSTRLNSSHVATTYAVFCLKKKRTIDHTTHEPNNQY